MLMQLCQLGLRFHVLTDITVLEFGGRTQLSLVEASRGDFRKLKKYGLVQNSSLVSADCVSPPVEKHRTTNSALEYSCWK